MNEIFNLTIYELYDIPNKIFKKKWKIIRDLSFIGTDDLDNTQIAEMILDIINKENIDTANKKILTRIKIEGMLTYVEFMFTFNENKKLIKTYINRLYYKDMELYL